MVMFNIGEASSGWFLKGSGPGMSFSAGLTEDTTALFVAAAPSCHHALAQDPEVRQQLPHPPSRCRAPDDLLHQLHTYNALKRTVICCS